ncbi:hypothetical protein TNCV_1501191 [Trichonephila clavipes]|uniref:Uncharacterized protein n=1 Tax=Trichonephila clavipes TaxID=2585209 RepID=A0A8X6RW45_TRICX|nr:hypothetical protein TNCV_1501191 [Trichonephila clavipes]
MATPSISTYPSYFGRELRMGGEYSPGPCTRDSTHKTFGATDLTSTYSVCTRRVFGGIGPRPSGLKSDALTTRLPTALCLCFNSYIATTIKTNLSWRQKLIIN